MKKILMIDVIVEIPKGSRNKYEYDYEKKVFKLDRVLYSSVHYPTDYGFIPDTLADDGDALDALVLIEEPTFTGCLIEAYPIGVIKMQDEKGIDHKIFCVAAGDPQVAHIKNLTKVPPHLLKEVEHFFEIYKLLEKKESVTSGWGGQDEALKVIKEARDLYRSTQKASS